MVHLKARQTAGLMAGLTAGQWGVEMVALSDGAMAALWGGTKVER
jgi:hypothetical protein